MVPNQGRSSSIARQRSGSSSSGVLSVSSVDGQHRDGPRLEASYCTTVTGVDRWGTGGTRPPHFSAWWGPHRKCPPHFFA